MVYTCAGVIINMAPFHSQKCSSLDNLYGPFVVTDTKGNFGQYKVKIVVNSFLPTVKWRWGGKGLFFIPEKT